MFRLCSTEGIKVLSKLAPRETQLILLACGGLTDKEIARSLSISVGTVITLWSTIRGKLGISSRAAAVSAMAWAVAKMEGRTVPELEEPEALVEGVAPHPATAVLGKQQIVLACNALAATMFDTRPGLTLDRSPILVAAGEPAELPWLQTGEREFMTDDIVPFAYPAGRLRQFLVNCTFLDDPVFGRVAVVRILPADEHLRPGRISQEAVVQTPEPQSRSAVVADGSNLREQIDALFGTHRLLSDQVSRLAEILDSILDDFYDEDRAPTLARVNLLQFLSSVISDVRLRVDDARTEIRLDVAPVIFQADTELLAVCFRTLIAHTVRLSSQFDWPRVLILGKKSDGRYRLTIRENGVALDSLRPSRGMPVLKRSFDPSAGVGLALATWAAVQLGGSVNFDPQSERATFILDFPLAPARVNDSSHVA